MTEKEMRRLSRADLLELLIAEIRENEKLSAELVDAHRQLEDRRIAIEQSGTLAEAALRLNGIFEAAQAAADQYLENVKAAADSGRTIRRPAEKPARKRRSDSDAATVTEILKKVDQGIEHEKA